MAEKTEGQKKGKGGGKMLMLVGALLLVEGGVIFGVMQFMGGPSSVQGVEVDLEAEAQMNRPVEVMVIQEKLPNQSTGRIWLYDTEIYISVKARHREAVEKVLQERSAEIRAGIRAIWAQAHHEDFKEPQLQKLTTQTREYLDQIVPPDEEGRSRLDKVLISRCNGFRADF
jgi:flagellar basal body-associated protein FliL